MRIVVALAVLVLTTSIAAAQAPGQTLSFDREAPPSAAEPQTVTVNYRGQVMLADGLSLGLLVFSGGAHNDKMAGWGIAGYFLGAPLVHAAHGRGTQALQSLGLRAGLPLLGGMLGYQIGPNDTTCIEGVRADGSYGGGGGCGDHGSIIGMVVGGLAGGFTAMVVDAKYLTKYEKRVTPSWTASIKTSHGGAIVGVSGTF